MSVSRSMALTSIEVQQDGDHHTVCVAVRVINGDLDVPAKARDRKATRMFVALSIADKCVTTRTPIMRAAVKGATSDATARDINAPSSPGDEQKCSLSIGPGARRAMRPPEGERRCLSRELREIAAGATGRVWLIACAAHQLLFRLSALGSQLSVSDSLRAERDS
jgi:hypothetical protein